MFDLIRRWRQARLEKRAADWVLRIDEDPTGKEAGLRKWVGGSESRARAYNDACRAFHGSSSAAQQIYGSQTERRSHLSHPRTARPDVRRRNQILAIGFSLLFASAALYRLLINLNVYVGRTTSDQIARSITTRIGEVRPIRLADGSRLLLDTDSQIRVAFSASARTVTMVRGRARFDVAHDPTRPFSVTVDGATLTDRGTVFDVEAYRYVRLWLISGAIDVAFPETPGRAPAPPVHLTAGQQLRFDPALTRLPPAPTATPQSDTQWVSGIKTFDDVPVSEILAEVNRYSTRQIVLADPALGTHRVFLDLDIRDVPTAAQNLALYLHLMVDRSQPGQFILHGPAK